MRAILGAGLALALIGCVPARIKTEIDFVDTVVQVGAKETAGFEAASDEDKLLLGEKAVRAIRRLKAHTENLKRWIERKGPADDSQ